MLVEARLLPYRWPSSVPHPLKSLWKISWSLHGCMKSLDLASLQTRFSLFGCGQELLDKAAACTMT